MKQIIAIGGGGFGREIGELKIEKYIVKQSNKSKPKVKRLMRSRPRSKKSH